MNCPNWFSLVARRDEEPELWDRALEHYDSCGRCREEALDAEPTLLFRRMPTPELGRDDLDAIKQAVSTMRRTLPLTESPAEPSSQRSRLGRSRLSRPKLSQPRQLFRSPRTWLQAAAVVAVLLGASWFQDSVFQGELGTEGSLSGAPTVAESAVGTVAESAIGTVAESAIGQDYETMASASFENSTLEELPLVEDADPSYGSIVEVVGQDISFVLVVPPLDV